MEELELSLELGTVKNVVDSHISHQSSSRHPAVLVPRFKVGGDWRYFIADFKDMMRLADLKLSHQLAYLKQAVPEKAEDLLYQEQVETVEGALEVLTFLLGN